RPGARPAAELRVRSLPRAGDRPVPLRGALEAEAQAELHAAAGERHVILGEAGVAATFHVEQIAGLEHDREVVVAAYRLPGGGKVDVSEAGGRGLQRSGAVLAVEPLDF